MPVYKDSTEENRQVRKNPENFHPCLNQPSLLNIFFSNLGKLLDFSVIALEENISLRTHVKMRPLSRTFLLEE